MSNITATVTTASTTYYGPSTLSYDSNGSVSVGDSVYVLWREGDWYYINYPVGSSITPSNRRKCMYVPCSVLSNLSETPYTYTAETYTSKELKEDFMSYTGPSAAYENAVEVYADWAIQQVNGITKNGFAFIEFPGDGNRYKRAWIPISKFTDYTPSNFTYSSEQVDGKTMHIMEVDPSKIVITELGEKMTLAESGFFGVNGGTSSRTISDDESERENADQITRINKVFTIAVNEDEPILNSFVPANTYGRIYDGTFNDTVYSCLTWTGSQIDVKNFVNLERLSTETITASPKVWCIGGMNLHLTKQMTDTAIHGLGDTIEEDFKRQCLYYDDPNEIYTSISKRTVIAADLQNNRIYLVAVTTGCDISTLRQCLIKYFRDVKGKNLENIVALNVDGGGSTVMRYSNTGVTPATRWLHTCISIV